ncbi:MAG: insulinase family protein [Candidatus Marinimicrobia bacterium]|nr:insulinase family protein [Candidatus Neomarinimicrobiota bacterium]
MLQHYNKTKLDNGITVLTESVDFVRSCAIGVFIKAGTRDENNENEGIAHFIEHLIFKGTKKRDAFSIVEEIEAYGGSMNAYTSKESTCIYARVLHDQVDKVLDVFSDIIKNSLFNDDDIQLEKSVVLEELKESEDAASEYSHDEYVLRMFPKHPIGKNILGHRKSIKNFSKTQINEFIKNNYTSNRIVIVATGAVDHEKIIQSTNKYFSNIPFAEDKQEFITPIKPLKKSWQIRRSVSQCHLLYGRQAWSYNFSQRMEYMLLNASLSAGMTSRLFRNIREKYGYAYSIYSYVDMFSDTGLFGIYAGTEENKTDKILELVWKEFEQIKQNGLDQDEFKKLKKQYEGNILMGAESMYNRMERLGRNEIQFKKFISYDESLKKIGSLNIDDIQALARELFDPDHFHTFQLLPK